MQDSEWAPYINRLPQPAEMHSTVNISLIFLVFHKHLYTITDIFWGKCLMVYVGPSIILYFFEWRFFHMLRFQEKNNKSCQFFIRI